jgi:hypothetical protein
MHCSVESGSRAETDADPNYFWPVRGSSPLTCPGIPAGGHGLLPQLQAREPAAHTGTVSEQCLEPNRAKFSRQLKRISVQMDSVVRVSPPSVSNASGSLKTARHVRLCRADNLVTVSEARPPAEPAAIPATGWIANPAHRKLAQTAGVCTGSNG